MLAQEYIRYCWGDLGGGIIVARLIDADALLKWAELNEKVTWQEYDAIEYAVAYAPTVELVKHGHWTEDRCCSECGTPIPTDNRLDYIPREEVAYCYCCGADMRGSRE